MLTLSRADWASLCGEDEVIGYEDEVGALTEAGEYADLVNEKINQLDNDVQNAIEGKQEALHPQFNFNEWNSFVNDTMWETVPPHGWRAFYDDLGPIDLTMSKAATMQRIAIFERAYADHRASFLAAGGQTETPEPEHPGVFETPEEREAREKEPSSWGGYATAALVLLGIGVVGYAATGVARLRGG